MLLAALLIYLAITGVVVFALAVAAASGNKHDVSLQRDAEIVEMALSQNDEVKRAS